MRNCEYRDLGRMPFTEAWELQRHLVDERKRGLIPDQLLIVEHPHVITLGRNARPENLLSSPEHLERAGVELVSTDRGGDVTYHGPGQIVGYPILDLKEWQRDVVLYVRGLEQAIIDALSRFNVAGERVPGCTGVWVGGAKIAAIGVHISRWVTSHGFALNVSTDLDYFRYIVPCGLSKPVTSIAALGCQAGRLEVIGALVDSFGRVFDCRVVEPVLNWRSTHD